MCVPGLDFVDKTPLKWSKIYQKHVFWPSLENHVISFPWNLCKIKVLTVINILKKVHAWEKSKSQVKDTNGSRPMRFQYSLVISISLID